MKYLSNWRTLSFKSENKWVRWTRKKNENFSIIIFCVYISAKFYTTTNIRSVGKFYVNFKFGKDYISIVKKSKFSAQ